MMDEKGVVREYFNTTGFERWRRIYGQDEVNWVQQDIRQGHERTLDTVLSWLESVKDLQICDAGCGVGSLAIPLAQRGAQVQASDISEQMVGEARQRAESQGLQNNPHFLVSDLEHLQGSFDVVICLDVMIHYPEADALRMVEQLTQLARQRLIFSFAPKTPLLTALKKIGEFFPGPSKTTRAYQHREQALVQQLQALGWEVKQRETIRSRFYFAWILNCSPKT